MVRLIAACALLAWAAPAAAACRLERIIELPVTMQGRRPVVITQINGVDARLGVDTGAFFSMLKPEAVQKFGLQTVGRTTVRGATGLADVGVAQARTMGLLSHPLRKVDFLVSPFGEPGIDGFLGQNILGGVDAEFDLANGVIRLWHAEGCGHSVLAYWDAKQTAAILPLIRPIGDDRHDNFMVSVNGQKIRVVLDSGAPRSILSLRAAERAGVKPEDAEVKPAGRTAGVGGRRVDTWIAPFASFALGSEEIRTTRLRIGQIQLEGADMLLGADFFLSHRIYVSKSQQTISMTYNGGPVFRLDQAGNAGPGPPAADVAGEPAQAGEPYSDTPTDAAGLARRGAASMSRGRFADAAADFGKAMELEPANPEHAYRRAEARLRLGEPRLARSDLDQAIKLKPDYADALGLRGDMRLRSRDFAGALADFEAAAARDPETRLKSANALADSGHYAEAVAMLDPWLAASARNPGRGAALNSRCWARALGGFDLDKALEDCDAALKLLPKNPGVLDSRALVELRLGRNDAAIADYDAALRQEPRMAWSLYGRGLAERRKGLAAKADADLKAAAEIAPELPERARHLGLGS